MNYRATAYMVGLLLVGGIITTNCKPQKTQSEESPPISEASETDAEAPVLLTENADATKSSVTLSSDLPFDVTITGTKLETSIREDFDRFSWESFIALNWEPNSDAPIGTNGDNATVWETWKNAMDVFLPDGKQPSAWGEPGTIPKSCKTTDKKVLAQVGKTPDLLNEMEQPFKTGPLIDQNGEYTRYEILMNQEMFDYIDKNGLYSFEGQQKFNAPAVFPEGSDSAKEWGAIMIKASWKILGDGDDPSKFHTVEAIVYTPAQDDPKIAESCFTAKVGLVGLHIGTKTKICPQWIWSTFEQVDNAPSFDNIHKPGPFNYYNASSEYPWNEAPARPWDPNIENQTPSQVVRLTSIFEGTEALNKEYQAKLRSVNPNSVWQYYELVGTQWPVNPRQLPLGNPFPEFLANSTLETYVQGIVEDKKVKLVPNVSSSCMHCHNGATMISNGRASDFTFLLERAQ